MQFIVKPVPIYIHNNKITQIASHQNRRYSIV